MRPINRKVGNAFETVALLIIFSSLVFDLFCFAAFLAGKAQIGGF